MRSRYYYIVFQDFSKEDSYAIALFVDKVMAIEYVEELMNKEQGIGLSIRPITQEDVHEYF